MNNTPEYIWFNGELTPWAEAKVHVLTHALHYGTSFFEGVRCYNTPKGPAIFRNKEHMQRLINSTKIYNLPLRHNREQLMKANKEILLANQLKNAYIRPLAFVGNVGLGVCPPEETVLDLLIAAFEWGAYLGPEALEKGVDVMVSSWNRAAANTIPTTAKAGGNYLSSLLIGSEARRNGYAEGIALDIHGYLSEGSGENLFLVKDNTLLTPLTTNAALPGITRDAIMTLAQDLGYSVKEQMIARETLYLADEIFMTGTAAEVVPVRSVDKITIGEGKCGPVTKNIQQAFFGLFTGKTEDKWQWLDYINN